MPQYTLNPTRLQGYLPGTRSRSRDTTFISKELYLNVWFKVQCQGLVTVPITTMSLVSVGVKQTLTVIVMSVKDTYGLEF